MNVSEKPRQGRYGSETKPSCCGKYMKKSTVRVLPDYQNYHVGWICMKCGKQILDEDKFNEVKERIS